MPNFSREKPPRRDRIIPLRVSAAEDQTIAALAQRLGVKTRADVLRAGLDLLLERHQPSAGKD